MDCCVPTNPVLLSPCVGEETARVLKEALAKYNLKDDLLRRIIAAFTSDSAANMVTLGEVLDFLQRFACLDHGIMNAIKFAFACLVPEDWAAVVDEVRWMIHLLIEPAVVKAVVEAKGNEKRCKVLGLYWQRFRGEACTSCPGSHRRAGCLLRTFRYQSGTGRCRRCTGTPCPPEGCPAGHRHEPSPQGVD